ncbi:MAG: hypothetical protein ACT4NY_00490 [Pseudonocardiales bacterium]
MLCAGDHAAVPESAAPESELNIDDRRPPDVPVPDPQEPAAVMPDPQDMTPRDLKPICGEEEFAALVENIVADEAPRLFAVVQEYGERVNFRIAEWGMAFDDHAEVIRVDRRLRLNLRAPENALRFFTEGGDLRPRLVWFNPDAISPRRTTRLPEPSAPGQCDGVPWLPAAVPVAPARHARHSGHLTVWSITDCGSGVDDFEAGEHGAGIGHCRAAIAALLGDAAGEGGQQRLEVYGEVTAGGDQLGEHRVMRGALGVVVAFGLGQFPRAYGFDVAVAFVADPQDRFGGTPKVELRERTVDSRGGLGSGCAQIVCGGVVRREAGDDTLAVALDHGDGAIDQVADVVGTRHILERVVVGTGLKPDLVTALAAVPGQHAANHNLI